MNLSKINNDYYTHIEDVISLHLKGIGFQFLLEKYRNEPLGVSKYIQMKISDSVTKSCSGNIYVLVHLLHYCATITTL